MTDDLPSLYQFDRWANARVIAACREVPSADYIREPVPGWSSLHATMYHIAGATLVWARRFEGEVVTSPPAEAETVTLDDVARMLDDAHGRIDRILASTSPEGLNEVREFVNFKKMPMRLPFWAALRHVVNHASYHRGQVASKLKRLGFDPPVTDLAAWAYGLTEQGA